MSDFDWRLDAYRSWELAIAEKRKQGVIEGRFEPRDDEERGWLGEKKS